MYYGSTCSGQIFYHCTHHIHRGVFVETTLPECSVNERFLVQIGDGLMGESENSVWESLSMKIDDIYETPPPINRLARQRTGKRSYGGEVLASSLDACHGYYSTFSLAAHHQHV
jgi:hypothetical protein